MRPSTADSIEADVGNSFQPRAFFSASPTDLSRQGDDASDFTMDETSTTDTASVVSDVRRY